MKVSVMDGSGRLKVGAIAVVLLAALAVFDWYGSLASGTGHITGAQVSGARCTDRQCDADPNGEAVCFSQCTTDGNWYSSSDCERKCQAVEIASANEKKLKAEEEKKKQLQQARLCTDLDCDPSGIGCLSRCTINNEWYEPTECEAKCKDAREAAAEAKAAEGRADCGKGENALIKEGETKDYVHGGRTYRIKADKVSSLAGTLTVTLLPQGASEATVVRVVDFHELGNFDAAKIGGGTVLLKTFTTAVDSLPYGIRFCLQNAAVERCTDKRCEVEQDGGAACISQCTINNEWYESAACEAKCSAAGEAKDKAEKGFPVAISPGWNIVGADMLYYLKSTSCQKSKIDRAVHSWNPRISDYDTAILTDALSPGQSFRLFKAVWLYNLGDACSVRSVTGFPSDYQFPLEKGWNMVSAQPEWEGKRFSDLLGTCKTFGGADFVGYSYDAENTRWAHINKGMRVEDAVPVGKGFLVFAEDDCELGLKQASATSGDLLPPAPAAIGETEDFD